MDVKHMREYAQRRDDLIQRARAASLKGMHFDDFLVGSAMLTWKGDVAPNQPQYDVFCGSNKKPEEKAVTFCAEPGALDAVRMSEYTDIITIVTYGPHLGHEDRASKKTAKTLHPCHRCRTILNYAKEVRDDTIVLCVLNGSAGEPTDFEEMTFLELLTFHNEVRVPPGKRK